MPPPNSASSLIGTGTHVASAPIDGVETITVTAAPRAIQRDPRPVEALGYDPRHGDAAAPEPGNVGQGACHSSAYNTVAGQPATGMDMVAMGGGGCN